MRSSRNCGYMSNGLRRESLAAIREQLESRDAPVDKSLEDDEPDEEFDEFDEVEDDRTSSRESAENHNNPRTVRPTCPARECGLRSVSFFCF